MGSGDSSQSVRVAVNIRPLVTPELLEGCTDCITVYPAQKQVQIGSHAFTFDYVFGSKGSSSSCLYDECVATLVDALFSGYNGTVLAYGQTGSGKTYTMGTDYNGEGHQDGVIPRVMDTIFSKMESMKECTEFFIRVSFIEIFKEEVFDLLDPTPRDFSKVEIPFMAKNTGPARAPIQIRETVSGEILLAGVTEAEVRTKEEMASYLLQGSLCRATGSTNMNCQSSRSHAIFTISMEQKKIARSSSGDDAGDEILIAKLRLVDLAGSVRAKRTGADGTRLQEGIHINKGLLALGNVISALGDDKKRKEGCHVPYRDSKLTRILQDSLGGNSKTIMIACVSPTDTNAEETINTLKYANRTRNIQNKAIINCDPMAAQMQKMRNQIDQLQAELLYIQEGTTEPSEEIKALVQAIEHELEVTVRVHEVRSEYERQKQERVKMAEEMARLKEEALTEKKYLSECPQTMSPGARNSRIFALENMLVTSSSILVFMASQLSEAEECERAFSGRGKWNQIRSLAEAKNVMDFLFDLALSSRCQLRDREVDCREKDEERIEFAHQENLMKLAGKRDSIEKTSSFYNEDQAYDLRPKGLESFEDMDTYDEGVPISEWQRTKRKRRRVRKISMDLGATEQVYCSCSRSSSCRTSRCECRAVIGNCNTYCSCKTTRCGNREKA